ncbi:hypothetical protein [Musicola paradisiaca]
MKSFRCRYWCRELSALIDIFPALTGTGVRWWSDRAQGLMMS